MFRAYLPILIVLVFSFALIGVMLGLSRLLSPRRPDRVKDSMYECGIAPVGDARMRHSVRFYVVAMLFIIFDLETVFLYPWAVTYRKLGLFGLVEMVIFLAILMVGLVYVWRRGALDWSGTLDTGAERVGLAGLPGVAGRAAAGTGAPPAEGPR
jgi:NADH-quinone oxidoreductase subunit A